MARINLPFSDAPVMAQSTPNYDQQTITNLAGETARSNEQLLGQAVAQADQLRQKAEKANMAKVEAENQASMGQLLAFGAKNIGNAMQEYTQKMLQIDHQETMLRQDRETDVFLLEAGTKLKEDMIYRLDGLKGGRAPKAPAQLPFDAKGNPTGAPMVPQKGGRTGGTGMKYSAGDGGVANSVPQPAGGEPQGSSEQDIESAAGAPTQSPTGLHSGTASPARNSAGLNPVTQMQWFNARVNADIAQAPNEKAKFAYMKMAAGLKLELLSATLSERRRAASAGATNALKATTKSIANAAAADPYGSGMAYLQSLNKVGEALKMNGYEDSKLGPFMSQAKSYLFGRQVEGLIKAGDPKTAFQRLADSGFSEVMTGQDYAKASYNTAQELLSIDLARDKSVKRALGINGIESGSLLPGMPGTGEYADLHFEGYMSQVLPNSQSVDHTNFRDITNAMMPYWKTYQNVGKDQNAFLGSKIEFSPNPYEVAGFSMGLYRMMRDPNNQQDYRAVANQLFEKEPKTMAMAMYVGRQVEAGVDPKTAVDNMRQQFDAKNAATMDIRKKEFGSILSGSDGQTKVSPDDIIKQAFPAHWWGGNAAADVTNKTQLQVEAIDYFQDGYMMSGDLTTAKQMAAQAIKAKYTISNVNGEKQVMYAAPEKYYQGKVLREFNSGLDQYVQNTFTKLGYEVNGRTVIKKDSDGKVISKDQVIIPIKRIQPILLIIPML